MAERLRNDARVDIDRGCVGEKWLPEYVVNCMAKLTENAADFEMAGVLVPPSVPPNVR